MGMGMGMCCCAGQCNVPVYDSTVDDDAGRPGPFFQRCQASGCTRCTNATPTRGTATFAGIASQIECVENDGNKLNRSFTLGLMVADCDWEFENGSGTTINICGLDRTVKVALTTTDSLATLTLDMDTLGVATFTKSVSLPGDCHAELTGDYTFATYTGTALKFTDATASVSMGCNLAPYWTLLDGVLEELVRPDPSSIRVLNDGGTEVRLTNSTYKPSRTSCKWLVDWRPEQDGDTLVMRVGYQNESNHWRVEFKAGENKPELTIWSITAGVQTRERHKFNVDSTFTFLDTGVPQGHLVPDSTQRVHISLCRKVLLVIWEGQNRDEGGLRPDHDTESYTVRPLVASVGDTGHAVGNDVVFPGSIWSIGAKFDGSTDVGAGFDIGTVQAYTTDRFSADSTCWPDATCWGLLTENPMEASFTVRGITDTPDPVSAGGYCTNCADANGDYSMPWTPGAGTGKDDCTWESALTHTLDCFNLEDVHFPPGSCDDFGAVANVNGNQINFDVGAGCNGTGSEQEHTLPASVCNGSTCFWKPSDVSTDWKPTTTPGIEGTCHVSEAESRFNNFTYEPDD
jgi:hypothetical protein